MQSRDFRCGEEQPVEPEQLHVFRVGQLEIRLINIRPFPRAPNFKNEIQFSGGEGDGAGPARLPLSRRRPRLDGAAGVPQLLQELQLQRLPARMQSQARTRTPTFFIRMTL